MEKINKKKQAPIAHKLPQDEKKAGLKPQLEESAKELENAAKNKASQLAGLESKLRKLQEQQRVLINCLPAAQENIRPRSAPPCQAPYAKITDHYPLTTRIHPSRVANLRETAQPNLMSAPSGYQLGVTLDELPYITPSPIPSSPQPLNISQPTRQVYRSLLESPHIPAQSSTSNLKLAIATLLKKTRNKDQLLSALTDEIRGCSKDTRARTTLVEGNPFMQKALIDYNNVPLTEYLTKLQPLTDKMPPHPRLSDAYSREIGQSGLSCGLRVLYKVGTNSLLLGWDPPRVSGITGYEIYVDGVLLHRVRSASRSQALLENLDLSKHLVLSMYAVTPYGRIPEPESIVYNAETEDSEYKRKPALTSQARSAPHVDTKSSPDQEIDLRNNQGKDETYFQEFFVGYAFDEIEQPASIEEEINKVGPAADAIKKIVIEQDKTIKKLVKEKEDLMEELKELKTRADKKSIDVGEMKEDVRRILSDHKRFGEMLAATNSSAPGPSADSDGPSAPMKEAEEALPPPPEESAPEPVDANPTSKPAAEEPVSEPTAEKPAPEPATEEPALVVAAEAGGSANQEISEAAEAMRKAGSVIDIIKNLVVGQDLEIKTLLQEREKMMQLLSNLDFRANRKSVEVADLTQGMQKLMSDHRRLQSILNASGAPLAEDSAPPEEIAAPNETEEFVEKVPLEAPAVDETEEAAPQFIENVPLEAPAVEETEEAASQFVEEVPLEAPVVEPTTEEQPPEPEAPQGEGEESEEVYESPSEIPEEAASPVAEPTPEPVVQPEVSEPGGALEVMDSDEKMSKLSRGVAEALRRAGSVIEIITFLVAEQDQEIQRLLKEKKKQLKELKSLEERADKKSIDVKEIRSEVQQLLSDHKRFQEILIVTSSIMNPIASPSAAAAEPAPEQKTELEAAESEPEPEPESAEPDDLALEPEPETAAPEASPEPKEVELEPEPVLPPEPELETPAEEEAVEVVEIEVVDVEVELVPPSPLPPIAKQGSYTAKEAMQKAGSVIEIIKKLVIKQDIEIKRLLSEREQQLQKIFQLEERAAKKSFDVVQMQEQMRKLLTDHEKFQNILNASKGAISMASEREEVIAITTIESEAAKSANSTKSEPPPEPELPAEAEQPQEAPEGGAEESEAPADTEPQAGEEAEEVFEDPQGSVPPAPEPAEKSEQAGIEIVSASDEEVANLSGRVAEALKRAGSVIEVIRLLVAEQDQEIQKLLSEKKRQLEELQELKDRADRKSLDVADLTAEVQHLMSDHKRFQEILAASQAGMGAGPWKFATDTTKTQPPISGTEAEIKVEEPAEEIKGDVITDSLEVQQTEAVEDSGQETAQAVETVQAKEVEESATEDTQEAETALTVEVEELAQEQSPAEVTDAEGIAQAEMVEESPQEDVVEIVEVSVQEELVPAETVGEEAPLQDIPALSAPTDTITPDFDTFQQKRESDVEKAMQKAGSVIESIQKLVVKQENEIKNLVDERKELLELLENLKQRADKKSVDFTDLKAEVAHIASDHKRFQNHFAGTQGLTTTGPSGTTSKEMVLKTTSLEKPSAGPIPEEASAEPIPEVEPAAEDVLEKVEAGVEEMTVEFEAGVEELSVEIQPAADPAAEKLVAEEPTQDLEPSTQEPLLDAQPATEETLPELESIPEEPKHVPEEAPPEPEPEPVEAHPEPEFANEEPAEATVSQVEEKPKGKYVQDMPGVSSRVRNALLNAGSLEDMIKNLIIEQDLQIQKLIDERNKHKEELKMLRERADKKSLDVTDIRSDIEKLMREHQKFLTTGAMAGSDLEFNILGEHVQTGTAASKPELPSVTAAEPATAIEPLPESIAEPLPEPESVSEEVATEATPQAETEFAPAPETTGEESVPESEILAEPETVDEPELMPESGPGAEPELTPESESVGEAVAEGEPVAEPEPAPESEPAVEEAVAEPEPVAETEVVPEPDPHSADEAIAEPESEPAGEKAVAESEPVVEPEVVTEPEPTPEPEAVAESERAGEETAAEPEPASELEPEPEPIIEQTDPEPSPEPGPSGEEVISEQQPPAAELQPDRVEITFEPIPVHEDISKPGGETAFIEEPAESTMVKLETESVISKTESTEDLPSGIVGQQIAALKKRARAKSKEIVNLKEVVQELAVEHRKLTEQIMKIAESKSATEGGMSTIEEKVSRPGLPPEEVQAEPTSELPPELELAAEREQAVEDPAPEGPGEPVSEAQEAAPENSAVPEPEAQEEEAVEVSALDAEPAAEPEVTPENVEEAAAEPQEASPELAAVSEEAAGEQSAEPESVINATPSAGESQPVAATVSAKLATPSEPASAPTAAEEQPTDSFTLEIEALKERARKKSMELVDIKNVMKALIDEHRRIAKQIKEARSTGKDLDATETQQSIEVAEVHLDEEFFSDLSIPQQAEPSKEGVQKEATVTPSEEVEVFVQEIQPSAEGVSKKEGEPTATSNTIALRDFDIAPGNELKPRKVKIEIDFKGLGERYGGEQQVAITEIQDHTDMEMETLVTRKKDIEEKVILLEQHTKVKSQELLDLRMVVSFLELNQTELAQLEYGVPLPTQRTQGPAMTEEVKYGAMPSTLSKLNVAIAEMRKKIKEKDKLIAALAKDVKARIQAEELEGIFQNIESIDTETVQPACDFDSNKLVRYLSPPTSSNADQVPLEENAEVLFMLTF